MGLGSCSFAMDQYISENGSKILITEKVFTFTLMAKDMKARYSTGNDKAKVHSIILMEQFIMDSGKTIIKMVKESRYLRRDRGIKEIGSEI